ncbi:MAG TPA: prolipoprotein diacylglyceryl transferase [Tepidisphaeraceae bacterium]|nr:prolipoprotein diacylglyceryl transferase [Tepidisphaeraceae bacterium]
MVLASIPYPDIDPVIFRLGPLALRWYGLAWVTGFLLAYLLLVRMAKRGILRMEPDWVGDWVFWAAVATVVGGRLGWWLFYHRDPGHPEPWYEPIAMWHGGMSFHGGLIGLLTAMFIWARVKRAPVLNLADAMALVVPVGLFFGRIANFINAELVGRPTDVPWGVIFPGESIARHPSQLYEAILEGPLLLALLWLVYRRWRPVDGRIAALFLIFYGVFRFGIEFTREPDVQLGFIAFGWLTMGQLLSLVLLPAGALLWWIAGKLNSGFVNSQSASGRDKTGTSPA